MGFTAMPTDGSSPTPLPMPSAVPDGTNTPFVTEGGPAKTTGGNTLAPVATYQYDGYNVVEGVTTDPAVTGDNSGTLSAKLRGLSKILTDIWDSVNHRIKVDGSGVTQPVSGTFWQATQPVSGTVTANAGTNLNTSLLALESGGHLANIDTHTPAQGQATKANSSPVVLASDQGDLLIKGDFTEVAGQAAGSVTSTSTPIINWTDVSAYKSWYFQMTGTWSMTLQVQFSNDGATPNQGLFFSSGTNGGFTLITANGQYYGPTMGRWMRIIPTVWTSNASGVGTLELHTLPISPHTMSVAQSGTWTVQPGNTANTTPWLVNAQRNTVAVYSLASTVTTGSTQNSGDLAVGPYAELSIDITTTAQAGTSPTIQYFYERKAADGIYYVLWQSAVLTLAANTLSTSIGAGMAYNQSLGATGRLRWVVGGSATPTFTHSLNIQAK